MPVSKNRKKHGIKLKKRKASQALLKAQHQKKMTEFIKQMQEQMILQQKEQQANEIKPSEDISEKVTE